MEIRVYFEGNRTLRPGFASFFRELKAAAKRVQSSVEFIAAKDGPSDYRKAARTHPLAWNILLKDSEEPMPAHPATLCKRHGIDASLVNNVFWMVELMESWFLAHPEALAAYYGKDFSVNALGQTADVERVPKSDVLRRLQQATKSTSKGRYDKVAHAPHLLETVGCRSSAAARAELPHA